MAAMVTSHEIIEAHQTQLGELILRRNATQMSPDPVYEITLDGQFLMSGLFNHSEIALADLGLAAVRSGHMDVVVGGLGLGCTAHAALAFSGLESLLVVEYLAEVIQWHRDDRVPRGQELAEDPRCGFVHGNFFALAAAKSGGFDPTRPDRRFDAILLDIDHSPRGLVHGSHRDFYKEDGLRGLASHLRPGGVFALWSSDAAEPDFIQVLDAVFDAHRVNELEHLNPLFGSYETNTIYVARTAPAPTAARS